MHFKGQFPGECDSERILKIGQYLTKLCVDYLGLLVVMKGDRASDLTFLAHPVYPKVSNDGGWPLVRSNWDRPVVVAAEAAEDGDWL